MCPKKISFIRLFFGLFMSVYWAYLYITIRKWLYWHLTKKPMNMTFWWKLDLYKKDIWLKNGDDQTKGWLVTWDQVPNGVLTITANKIDKKKFNMILISFKKLNLIRPIWKMYNNEKNSGIMNILYNSNVFAKYTM